MNSVETAVSFFLLTIFSVPPLLLAVFGICLFRGKGFSLLAGYSELPKEKKERLNRKALGRFLGGLLFVLAFCTLLWPIGLTTDMRIFWLGLALFCLFLTAGVLYLNTGNRFQK